MFLKPNEIEIVNEVIADNHLDGYTATHVDLLHTRNWAYEEALRRRGDRNTKFMLLVAALSGAIEGVLMTDAVRSAVLNWTMDTHILPIAETCAISVALVTSCAAAFHNIFQATNRLEAHARELPMRREIQSIVAQKYCD